MKRLFMYLMLIVFSLNAYSRDEKEEFTFTFKESTTAYPYIGDEQELDQWGTYKINCTSVAAWNVNIFLGMNHNIEKIYKAKAEDIFTARFEAAKKHNELYPSLFGNYIFSSNTSIPLDHGKDWDYPDFIISVFNSHIY